MAAGYNTAAVAAKDWRMMVGLLLGFVAKETTLNSGHHLWRS